MSNAREQRTKGTVRWQLLSHREETAALEAAATVAATAASAVREGACVATGSENISECRAKGVRC